MIQNIHGRWLITEEDIKIGQDDMLIDDDYSVIDTYLETWFDVDLRFGTNTHDTDDFINFYVSYDPYTGNMEGLYYIHYVDGDVSDAISVDLYPSEQAAILSVMKKCGLDELIKEMENNKNETIYS